MVEVNKDLEILDTPGILWPKFEDELVGLKLALTGAIKDQLLPMDEVTIFGLNYFKTYYPERLEERFKGIDLEEEAPEIIMEMTRKLGFREDYDRFYNLFVKEVRDGKLGRYTLDIVGVDTEWRQLKEVKEQLSTLTDLDDYRWASFEEDSRAG